VTLAVGVGSALLTATIGTLVGALAGYYGRRTDTLLSGGINLMLSIPTLPLALVLSAFVEVNLPLLILIIGGVSWTSTARIVRAETLSLRERDFVASARALGAGDGRLILQHILINAMPPIIVAATLQVATAIAGAMRAVVHETR
jgi:peptide/nickel transport system permease protein